MTWIIPDTFLAGDIVEVSSKIPSKIPVLGGKVVSPVKHYGMIVFVDGKLSVAHNPTAGRPIIEPIDVYTRERNIERVLRTFMTNEQVLQRFEMFKNKKYTFCKYNCEDFVRSMCDCDITGIHQCRKWGKIFLWIVIIVLIIALIFKCR